MAPLHFAALLPRPSRGYCRRVDQALLPFAALLTWRRSRYSAKHDANPGNARGLLRRAARCTMLRCLLPSPSPHRTVPPGSPGMGLVLVSPGPVDGG